MEGRVKWGMHIEIEIYFGFYHSLKVSKSSMMREIRGAVKRIGAGWGWGGSELLHCI